MIEPGIILSGKYKVIEKIGMGGMGAVYRAVETGTRVELDRSVAIKVLHPHMMTDEVLTRRFEQEIKILARLNHQHIVRIYNVDEDQGCLYYVMQFVEGETLKALIKRSGALDQAQVVDITLQIADAVYYLHKAGTIHRDIKPVNIMLDADGCAILMDFGIAKMAGGVSLTTGGEVLGTAPYMAPEQWEGKHNPSSDIYALGILMYEMLTGAPPFASTSITEIMAAHLKQEPAPLLVIRPNINEPLARAVHRCLAKSPEDRFPSAAELIYALEDVEQVLRTSTPAEAGQMDATLLSLDSDAVLKRAATHAKQLLYEGQPQKAYETLFAAGGQATEKEMLALLTDLQQLASSDDQAWSQARDLLDKQDYQSAQQILETHLRAYPFSRSIDLLESLPTKSQVLSQLQQPADPPPAGEYLFTKLEKTLGQLEQRKETPVAASGSGPKGRRSVDRQATLVGPAARKEKPARRRRWLIPAIIGAGVVVLLGCLIAISFIANETTSNLMLNIGTDFYNMQCYKAPPMFNAAAFYNAALYYQPNNQIAERAMHDMAKHLADVGKGYASRGNYRIALRYLRWSMEIDNNPQTVREYNRVLEMRKKKK